MMTMKTTKNANTTIPQDLTQHLAHARKNLETAENHLEALEATVRKLARGTRDLAPRSGPAVLAKPTVADRVETVLRSAVLSPAELALAVGAPQAAVDAAVRSHGRKITNVGIVGAPRLSWVAGDDGPTPELIELIARLIAVRPLAFSELIQHTGARGNRISGAIVKLQQHPKIGHKVVNRGTAARALWFLKPR